MYHAACKVEFQPFTVVLTADVFQLFIKLFIALHLFVVVKQWKTTRFVIRDSTGQTQPTRHGAWSSTAGTYVLRPV